MTFIEQKSASGKTQRSSKLLKGCPFCGTNPHHGLGKVEHCQLHGEPFQRFRIWCPRGCAEKSHPNKDWAVQDWNTRSEDHTAAGALDILRRLYPIVKDYDDEGPRGEQWQSDELMRALADAAALIKSSEAVS